MAIISHNYSSAHQLYLTVRRNPRYNTAPGKPRCRRPPLLRRLTELRHRRSRALERQPHFRRITTSGESAGTNQQASCCSIPPGASQPPSAASCKLPTANRHARRPTNRQSQTLFSQRKQRSLLLLHSSMHSSDRRLYIATSAEPCLTALSP